MPLIPLLCSASPSFPQTWLAKFLVAPRPNVLKHTLKAHEHLWEWRNLEYLDIAGLLDYMKFLNIGFIERVRAIATLFRSMYKTGTVDKAWVKWATDSWNQAFRLILEAKEDIEEHEGPDLRLSPPSVVAMLAPPPPATNTTTPDHVDLTLLD